jgi:hypothetical protein
VNEESRVSRYHRGSRLDILRAEAMGLDTDHVSDKNVVWLHLRFIKVGQFEKIHHKARTRLRRMGLIRYHSTRIVRFSLTVKGERILSEVLDEEARR